MTSKLITGLAFVTFVHLGARTAAPATVMEVSDFETPSELPAEVAELRPEAAEHTCQLWVFFDPGCPACNRAALAQARQGELPLDLIWVSKTDEGAEAYALKVHPEAHLVVDADASARMKVQAVPAAFVVSGDRVLYSSPISGEEDLNVVAGRCTAA